ncbi:MAG: hypothetical protein QOH03_292 [Kribbellaceae bacterium]|jgi:hypothetical protein|nr:hypothetical protein [Kribbellaceae bacterium]
MSALELGTARTASVNALGQSQFEDAYTTGAG